MKMNEFEIFDWGSLKKYHGKVFLFEKCLIYTEAANSIFQYRGYFDTKNLENNHKFGKSNFKLSKRQHLLTEIEFSSSIEIAYLWNQLISALKANETEIEGIDISILLSVFM